MPWIKKKLRDNTVFVRVDADGKPAAGRDGRVDIAYALRANAKIYRASVRNLAPTGDDADEIPFEPSGSQEEPGGKTKAPAKAGPLPDDALIIYTDGACTGNPGPAGLGVVIIDGEDRNEISEYLGQGTNNIAELTAILRALEEVPAGQRDRTVAVHSDSSYSIGLLTKNWKAKANKELVATLRELAGKFSDLRLIKVKGHAGVPENERADELAREAVERRG